VEVEEEGAEDAEAWLAHDAVAAASGPRAAFQALDVAEDADLLLLSERPAVGAGVGNKPGSAAKGVSHGDFSQA